MILPLSKNNLISDLPGIRIYYGEIQESNDGRLVCSHSLPKIISLQDSYSSDFDQIFQPILKELQVYSWLVDLECFNLNNLSDDDYDKVVCYLDSILVNNIAYLSDDPEFIIKFSHLVKDDWNQLWGLKKPLNNIKKLVDSYPIYHISQDIPAEVSVIFDNYDGAYWSFFSNEMFLHETIKQNLYKKFGKEKIKIIDISFQDSLQEHQEQWEFYCKTNF